MSSKPVKKNPKRLLPQGLPINNELSDSQPDNTVVEDQPGSTSTVSDQSGQPEKENQTTSLSGNKPYYILGIGVLFGIIWYTQQQPTVKIPHTVQTPTVETSTKPVETIPKKTRKF